MKTRIVWTKIWEDDFFVSRSRIGKLLFLYLITNQRINLSGFYEISDRVIMFDLGLSKIELEKAKREVFPKVVFYKGWVYVVNAKELGGYKGKKNKIAIEKELYQIPSHIKKAIKSMLSDRVSKKSDRVSGVSNTPINNKLKIINNITSNTSKYINTFNKLFNTKYTITNGRKEKLKTRLKTFPLKKILSALDNLSKSKFHRGDNDRGWVADPDFLIRSDEQVDKWLNKEGKSDGPKFDNPDFI